MAHLETDFFIPLKLVPSPFFATGLNFIGMLFLWGFSLFKNFVLLK